MYKKSAQGWLKHWDFLVLDLVCMQVCLVLAYIIRHGIALPYASNQYLKLSILFMVVQLLTVFFGESYKNILKRGYYIEFVVVAQQDFMIMLLVLFYLFVTKQSQLYSRISFVTAGILYLFLCYFLHLLMKKIVCSRRYKKGRQLSLMLITDSASIHSAIESVRENWSREYAICGIALMDHSCVGETVEGIPVIADQNSLIDYICHAWIDEVFIKVAHRELVPEKIKNALIQMGVTIHMNINELENAALGERQVEKIGNNIVLTYGMRMVTPKQMFYKRAMDVAGGIAGCLITGILYVFIAPVIYCQSPGPIFFSQTRIGRNGKKFKIYKFRSMYMDAEERKKELMEQNKIKDGLMFKMDQDPRIIGSEKIKRNGKPGGIGNFIRKTSIDEFPQFWNVLKGDMSLVGTRPPTLDEWEKYEFHHRARMAIKPGITGMWQISGRSDILDFEEVIRLDTGYIEKWNIGLDIKILLMTVVQVLKSDGAM